MNKREYNEQYRLKHKDDYARYQRKYYRANSKRLLAQRAAQKALNLGVIERKPCEICGDAMKAVHMVHDDYDNQLEVSWLCHECLKEIEDEVAAVESNLNPYVWGTQLIYRDKGRINNE